MFVKMLHLECVSPAMEFVVLAGERLVMKRSVDFQTGLQIQVFDIRSMKLEIFISINSRDIPQERTVE